MKMIHLLLVMSLMPVACAAQQSNSSKPVDVDYHCDKDPVVQAMCEEMEKRDKESQLAFEANEAERIKHLTEKAAEAKKIADDANKVRSTNKDEQIDGLVGTAQNINSHANRNDASEVVTDDSLSLVDQFAHRENELLNNTANTVRSGLEPKGGTPSSFNAGERHQLDESTKGAVEPPPPTLEQQFQNRAQTLSPPSSVGPAAPGAESPKSARRPEQTTLEQQWENQEGKVLASPAAVKSVAQADRAIQAKERERRAIEAKREADHRAELAREARAQAEAERVAEQERREKAAAEDAKEEREERAEAAREARAERAAWNALFGPPPSQPAWSASPGSYGSAYVPYVPPSTPSYPSQNGFSGNYLSQSGTKPPSSPDTFNYFSCMDNLSTEYSCIQDHQKAAGVEPQKPVSVFDMFGSQQSAPQGGNNQAQSPPAQTPPATTAAAPTAK